MIIERESVHSPILTIKIVDLGVKGSCLERGRGLFMCFLNLEMT
jgi:hypothetical protein